MSIGFIKLDCLASHYFVHAVSKKWRHWKESGVASKSNGRKDKEKDYNAFSRSSAEEEEMECQQGRYSACVWHEVLREI